MSSTFCPDLSGDAAVIFVGDGHARFREITEETFDLAVHNLNNLGTVAVQPVTFTVDFDFQGQLGEFIRPQRPVLDGDGFEFRDPGIVDQPPALTPQDVPSEQFPSFDTPPPSLQFGPRPLAPIIAAPIAPPRPPPVDVPLPPDYVLPDVPALEALQLPAFPDIQLPPFLGERPVFIDPGFNENWHFMPSAYTEQLLPQLKAEILRQLSPDESALPLAIQELIFKRGRDRIQKEVARSVETTIEEWASRGFNEAPGQLQGRIVEVRREGEDRGADLNRDLTIKAYEEALTNLRNALAQGAALEGVFIQLHIEEQRFALEASRFGLEAAVAVLNARVTVFNTRMAGYKIDADVWEIAIRAELAELEVLRAQLERERLRGEQNDQRVRLYAERIRALGLVAEFYRTRIEGVKVQAEANKIPIEIFREEVGAFEARWRANAAEWSAYSASVEGEGKKADLHKTLADIFATETSATATRQQTHFQRADLSLRQDGQRLDVYRAGISRLDAILRTEGERLRAVSAYADAQARIYGADAQVESAASAAMDRTFELGLARERAKVDTQLESARILVQQNIALIQELRDIRGTIAQVSGQLAASAFSAVNYSASVSSTRSKGISCSTDFNFAGEISDASSF